MVIVLCLAYIIFVAVDCNRLRSSKLGTKPLIVVSESHTENCDTYYSLGYSIEYEDCITKEQIGDITYIEDSGDGVTFKFLGKIVWSWWE